MGEMLEQLVELDSAGISADEVAARSVDEGAVSLLHAAPASPHLRDDGWTIDLEHGSIASIAGPYIVSGGWWAAEVHREYHYAETLRGDCLWLYFDVPRRRWWHHAETN